MIGEGFVSGTADVNGTRIHYVRGGRGPTVVLLHGFPQDWYAWRRIMPRLAARFTVLAVDLRGVGESAPSADGYASVELARDVHQLVEGLDLGPSHLVGHDIGGMVAYAFAREFPERTRTVAVLEVPIPGIEPAPVLELDAPLWHAGFHMTPHLPEALVTGRQSVYFRYFFDTFTVDNTAIGDADLAHYAHAYRDPDHLRSAFEFYRAIPATAAYNAGRTEPIDVPLLLIGGEHLFGPIMPRMAESLRSNYGWSDVRVDVVENAGHYLVEERPDEVAGLIERHIG
ncbi:alpha/beta fold hydrolase [Pseudonocardia acaciae]|uniref:alpha/beta fold hydrolase n=1 Tax=Pseudonocardia acaciae TaxID=551276 RepID=UPI00048D13CF|nr:alpha/beta fold hydrolase [Pseudonocardia acaciae]